MRQNSARHLTSYAALMTHLFFGFSEIAKDDEDDDRNEINDGGHCDADVDPVGERRSQGPDHHHEDGSGSYQRRNEQHRLVEHIDGGQVLVDGCSVAPRGQEGDYVGHC